MSSAIANPDTRSRGLSVVGGARLLKAGTQERDGGRNVLSDAWPTPVKIIGELLQSDPEAESLLAEAGHCRALAATSVAGCDAKFAVVRAARRAYEELRHRLEPRRGRPVHFAAGMLVLAVLGAGLVLLNWTELIGLLAGPQLLLLAVGATAVWVTVAWLSSLAASRRRWDLLGALAGIAAVLGMLLAVCHGSVLSPGRWIPGCLAVAFILVLTGGAAALIAHTESASLLVARQRWHRRAEYERAVRTREADIEAAAVTRQAWLSLVRAAVMKVAAGDDDLLAETVALAGALLESSPPALPAETR
jgi:hypothetical protein